MFEKSEKQLLLRLRHFAQDNQMKSIEHLEGARYLRALDLSENKLVSLQGIETLTLLRNLNCAHNEGINVLNSYPDV